MSKVIINMDEQGEEIYTSIPEDDSSLLDLEDTLDLSELVNNE